MKTSVFRSHALIAAPFFAFGLFALAGLFGWVLAEPELVFAPGLHAARFALLVLALPACLASLVFGLAYHFVPVIAETRLRSRFLGYLHAGLHVFGTTRLFFSLLDHDYGAATRWGVLVIAGLLVGVVNLLATASHRSRWTPDKVGLLLGLFWLTVSICLGTAFAFARDGGVTPLPPDRLLHLYLACGLVGFLLTTLAGLCLKALPLHLLNPVRGRARAWTSLVLLYSGMILLGPGLLGNLPAVTLAGVIAIALGILFFVTEVAVSVARRSHPLDWPLRTSLLGIAALAPAALVAVCDALGHPLARGAMPDLGPAALLVGGFAVMLPILLGLAGKSLPFLAWQWKYADHLGRAAVPAVKDLLGAGWLQAQFWLLVPTVACAGAATILGSASLLRISAAFALASLVPFVAALGHVIRQLQQHPAIDSLLPGTPPRSATAF